MSKNNYLKKTQKRKFEVLLFEGSNSGEFTPLTKEDFKKIKERGIKRLQRKVGK